MEKILLLKQKILLDLVRFCFETLRRLNRSNCEYKIYFFQAYNTKGKKGINVEPCPLCGAEFKHSFRRNSHVKVCGKVFECVMCGKVFKSKQSLMGHNNAKHTENFKCSACSKCFESESKLNRHILTHEEKGFICEVCGKLFLRKDNMIQHVKNTH